jgi:DNA repair protein RadC
MRSFELCLIKDMVTHSFIASSQEAYRIISPLISRDQEEVWVLGLSRDLSIIQAICCFRGSVDSCMIHPRELFAPLIQMRASQFILAHNHPRGSPEPSQHDIEMTRVIEKAGRILMLPLIDHIVIAQSTFVSFNQRGLLKVRQKSSGLFT